MERYIKSIHDLKKSKAEKRPISMVTCYDYTTARLVAQSLVDTILIGDSGGMVNAGYDSTVPVTVDEIIFYARAVKRGAPEKFIVADMPFLSYHAGVNDAVKNAGRIMKETGVQAVKLEGGEEFAGEVRALTRASIPVVGHLGFTPQSVHMIGGNKVQGRGADQAEKMMRDAKCLEESGACALVLEMVPESLAGDISASLSIPTIGIGGGRYCDGQVLVISDLLGMNESFNPKFLKKYADLSSVIRGALDAYDREVKERIFPGEGNAFQ
ncbi:MAG: 3-methyl-2-oxobutanoate hydroxymethyltransferase [Spirochaetota bacterium]